jgi:hypothetical protein
MLRVRARTQGSIPTARHNSRNWQVLVQEWSWDIKSEQVTSFRRISIKILHLFRTTEQKGISVSRSQGQGCIDTILLRDTPLSPDTCSHQIWTKNTERKGIIMQFWVKVTGSRSKFALTLIFCVTHLCPLIYPPTKYQPKIFSRLGIIERKGNIMQFGVKVKGHIDTNLLPDT